MNFGKNTEIPQDKFFIDALNILNEELNEAGLQTFKVCIDH